MATYKQIQGYVKETHGYTVKTCWIAHVKEICGLKPKKAWNRKAPEKRANPCPTAKIEPIKQALRYFGMIWQRRAGLPCLLYPLGSPAVLTGSLWESLYPLILPLSRPSLPFASFAIPLDNLEHQCNAVHRDLLICHSAQVVVCHFLIQLLVAPCPSGPTISAQTPF